MKFYFDYFVFKFQDYLGWAAREASVELQDTPEKTQWIDVRRRIRIYLHALWGSEFFIKPINQAGERVESRQPYIEKSLINVPACIDDFTLDGIRNISGLEFYRAATTHAAAHIIYSKHDFADRLVNKWQRAVIATIEDARVETLSIRKYPGLKQLWARQHIANPSHNQTADDYLNRMARALLDENYQDDDPWINRCRSLFMAAKDIEAEDFSWDFGLSIEYKFNNKKIKLDNVSEKPWAPYRDDNRHLWASQITDLVGPIEIKWLKLLSTNNTLSGTEKDKKRPTMQMRIKGAPVSDTYIYPEWDYRSQISTPSWVTLRCWYALNIPQKT